MFKDKNITTKDLYWFCVAAGISSWLFDSFIEVYVSFGTNIIKEIFAPDIHEIFIRFIYLGVIVVFYFYSSNYIKILEQSNFQGKMYMEQLMHANHMTILGSLVNGTVHDFKNPNSVLSSNAPLLMDIWSDLEKILKECNIPKDNLLVGGLEFNDAIETVPLLLNGINESSKKMNNIVDGLREFSNLKDPFPNSLVDINDIIKYCTTLMSFGLCRGVENLKIDLSPDLPKIKGNRIKIVIIIMNLLQNAISSLNPGGSDLIISTSLKNDGSYVIMNLIDNGRGMTANELKEIYRPFFTTYRKDKNLGLGLYTVNALLKDLNGTIKINSTPSKGTEILIEFPVLEAAPPNPARH
ncbi:MAG: HAMP domain-containing histidine kinase [Nitrospirae bacterium]|nr:HAMP domain-containing histidine kinase [Nitrospirota bacterium]